MLNFLELKFPPPLQAVVHAAAMRLVSAQMPALAFTVPGSQTVGAVIACMGLSLVIAGIVTLRMARTTVNPLTPGASTALVTTGIFRLSRNPMYVGVAAALTGWALYLAHGLAFLFVPFFVLYMNRFQILPEERILSAKFSEAYARYKQSVRRWL